MVLMKEIGFNDPEVLSGLMLDEMKEIMARKYENFNKPAKDWMGDDDDVIIGGDQMVDFGQADMMFEITDPHGNSANH